MATNIEAIRFLQRVASYYTAHERTASLSKAEYIVSDCILSLWNDPNTNRREYWS